MAQLIFSDEARPILRSDARLLGLEQMPTHDLVCLVKTEDVWVLQQYGPWTTAYRLAVKNGRVVVSELRVYPTEKSGAGRPAPSPGEWHGSYRGLKAVVPADGITSTLIHAIKPARDVGEGRMTIGSERARRSTLWKELTNKGLVTEAVSSPRTGNSKGGPLGRGLRFYKQVAKHYQVARAAGIRAVNQYIAEQIGNGMSAEQARDAVWRARNKYGLLAKTRRGVPSPA